MSGATVGTVYLPHFDAPFGHAKHYTGWSADLPARLAEHGAGRGARLTELLAGPARLAFDHGRIVHNALNRVGM
ncbi:MAG TPA: hypothetical protein VGS97_10455 [Actinocrinis sp.]|uniref:hypothetical protein n=1 Tax=Actinocrinis sp. TaxID=1920516 RepID=UPI002DDD02F9|nr:hypothetical protein [Actinocrinis sp.]HEV2344502.1 hypothetical protein [Actinocrinis sp.]